MIKCSVCQIVAFSEKAHMRARHSFKKHEFDKYQNIVPICPVCHYFFDKKAFNKWGKKAITKSITNLKKIIKKKYRIFYFSD